MQPSTNDRVPTLNIRIKAQQRDLIERAAKQVNKTVSDFVRDAALRDAQNAILDRVVFQLDPEAWDKFTAALDAPPKSNPRLRDLLTRQAPWEE